MARAVWLFLVLCALGCRSTPEPGSARVRFWHTFQPHETELLNAEVGASVETTLVPLHRGLVILLSELGQGRACPDLVRIDSTWLVPLARADRIQPIPPAVFGRWSWLPEADELARVDGQPYALPQSLDGLVLVHHRLPPILAWPPASLDDLWRAAQTLDAGNLSMRIDGFWFVPFLRAQGLELSPELPAGGRDELAVTEFASWFAPAGPAVVLPLGEEEHAEIQRFRSGKVQIVVTGPWSLFALSGGRPHDLRVVPFPTENGTALAPRGGSLLVVPRCAPAPERGFALALDLTNPSFQARWAERFGIVPTTTQGLAAAPRLVKDLYHALATAARPLPRTELTPWLFDDLTPALQAVIARSATADEALDGVRRAWHRLQSRARP